VSAEPQYVLSTYARRDLDEILQYVLEQSGPRRAQHVLDRLEDAFRKLSKSPALGHRREDLTPRPVKFFSVWSYLVIYDPESRPLRIVRVFHAARDVESILSRE